MDLSRFAIQIAALDDTPTVVADTIMDISVDARPKSRRISERAMLQDARFNEPDCNSMIFFETFGKPQYLGLMDNEDGSNIGLNKGKYIHFKYVLYNLIIYHS